MKTTWVLAVAVLGLFCCNHQQVRDEQKPPTAAVNQPVGVQGQKIGTVLYGSKSTSVALYETKSFVPEYRYYYSEQRGLQEGRSEVKLACIIDADSKLVKVVHYTHRCSIATCKNDKEINSIPDVKVLGDGIELFLGIDTNQLDCNGTPVQIPTHPSLL